MAAPEVTPEAPAERSAVVARDCFLREGLEEVRASAEIVHAENVELRARIDVLRGLTANLARASGLPQDVRSSLQTVLNSAAPPHAAFDPSAGPPAKGLEGKAEPARNMVQGRVFALNVRELCRSMDLHEASHSRTAKGAPKAGPRRGEGPGDGSEDEELLALTEHGEGLWGRTRAVCRELLSGWT